MRISSFNINKFCGAYSHIGYCNPRKIDFQTEIKDIVESHLSERNDIFFLQEFINNIYINVKTLFPDDKYKIHGDYQAKSNVVAITLKESNWKLSDETKEKQEKKADYYNKILIMQLGDFSIIGVHNTTIEIENKIVF